MSPERINGEPYSFPADVWALGLTLLECATGRYPYDASGGTMQLMIQVWSLDEKGYLQRCCRAKRKRGGGHSPARRCWLCPLHCLKCKETTPYALAGLCSSK